MSMTLVIVVLVLLALALGVLVRGGLVPVLVHDDPPLVGILGDRWFASVA